MSTCPVAGRRKREVQVPSKSPENSSLPHPAVIATLVHYYFAQATGAPMKETNEI